MPTDPTPDPLPPALEPAIRVALRSDEIGESDLRRPSLGARRATHRRRRATPRILAVAASVAAILALGVTIGVFRSGGTGNAGNAGGTGGRPPAGGTSRVLDGVTGYRWQVTRVLDPAGSFAVAPTPKPAGIGFTRDGYVLGDDTINALQGRVASVPGSPDAYEVVDAASTLVGSTRLSAQRQRLVDAVDGMVFSVASSPQGQPPPVQVRVHLDGDTLTLTRDGTTLTLTRAGAQPDFFAGASPTPTASATGTPIEARSS